MRKGNIQDTDFCIGLIIHILGGVVFGPVREYHELWISGGRFHLCDIGASIADQVPRCSGVALTPDEERSVQAVHEFSSNV